MLLNFKEKKEIQSEWLGEKSIHGTDVDAEDFLRICPKKWMNGDVITKFLVSETNDLKVDVFDTHLYTNLVSGRATVQTNTENMYEVFKRSLVLIPVHHRTLNGHDLHCSMVGIYPKEIIVCHFHSLQQSSTEILSVVWSFLAFIGDALQEKISLKNWQFFSPNDIPGQWNGFDCGVFACMYAVSLIKRRIVCPQNKEDVNVARYYKTKMSAS